MVLTFSTPPTDDFIQPAEQLDLQQDADIVGNNEPEIPGLTNIQIQNQNLSQHFSDAQQAQDEYDNMQLYDDAVEELGSIEKQYEIQQQPFVDELKEEIQNIQDLTDISPTIHDNTEQQDDTQYDFVQNDSTQDNDVVTQNSDSLVVNDDVIFRPSSNNNITDVTDMPQHNNTELSRQSTEKPTHTSTLEELSAYYAVPLSSPKQSMQNDNDDDSTKNNNNDNNNTCSLLNRSTTSPSSSPTNYGTQINEKENPFVNSTHSSSDSSSSHSIYDDDENDDYDYDDNNPTPKYSLITTLLKKHNPF
eukprot:UN04747